MINRLLWAASFDKEPAGNFLPEESVGDVERVGFIVVAAGRIVVREDVSFGRLADLDGRQAVALRFGLEAGIIDLAGRVLVRLQTQDNPAPVFADPAHPEELLTLENCKQYIFERNLQWDEAFITPLSSHAVLRRIFSHMIFVLNKLRDERRLTYLRRYMDILKD